MKVDKITISKPLVSEAAIKEVVRVLKSGHISQGEVVGELEKQFARYCGVKYAVAVNSGTAAIHCVLYGVDIKPGDEVITSPFTFVATANPILALGGKVVFADINEIDFCLDPSEVKRKLTNKTKAIFPVDLYGQPADYKHLNLRKGIKIVADACQAIGGSLDGKKVGSLADVSAFSLYATKNIMSAEGGVVTTDSKEIVGRCMMFRNHGQDPQRRYSYVDFGLNYRMTDVLAAIALPQVGRIDKITRERNLRAKRYTKNLSGLPGIILPVIRSNAIHCFHQYTIRVTDKAPISRDQLVIALNKANVFPGIYYPLPLHLHPHFMKMGYKEGDFPVAERIAKEVLSLPVHPAVTLKQIDFVSKVIKVACGEKGKN